MEICIQIHQGEYTIQQKLGGDVGIEHFLYPGMYKQYCTALCSIKTSGIKGMDNKCVPERSLSQWTFWKERNIHINLLLWTAGM